MDEHEFFWSIFFKHGSVDKFFSGPIYICFIDSKILNNITNQETIIYRINTISYQNNYSCHGKQS